MRILTNSRNSLYGLIKVVEAEENSPQHLFFCIPIDSYEAKQIGSISDFRKFFRQGIKTQISSNKNIGTISMEFHGSSLFDKYQNKEKIPKFIANVIGQKIDFHLSALNFENYNFDNRLSINFFYDGDTEMGLLNKRFIILEPDWKALDKIFLEHKITFTDWSE